MAPRSEEEQHVAAIRSEYGKGEGGPELSQAVRGSLQAACQLLSEQLYNTDAHFLSELIQNADDNAYAPGVRPQLVIKLLDRGMSLRNNELGFEARNVTAICALGNSSKSKAQGQTGEKGIGFKAVFMVADAAFINSRGYSFCFDKTQEMGMIVPQWVSPESFPVPLPEDGGTSLFLRFKPGFDKQELQQAMEKVHPYILVFLNKLHQLEMHLPLPDGTMLTRRHEVRTSSNEDITITVTQQQGGTTTIASEHHLLTLRKVFEVPSEVYDDKRKDVKRTPVVLAFPVDADGRPLLLPNVPVFGYLPICCMGLKFAVQADFVLVASRESILGDRPWNKWLRGCVAEMLAGPGLELLKQRQPDGAFLQYLPAQGEISADSFMTPLEPQLLELLRKERCALAHDGSWHKPGDLLLPAAPFMSSGKSLLPGGMLLRLSDGQLKYVDSWLAADERSRSVLGCLGTRTFRAEHLVQCLTHSKADAELLQQLQDAAAGPAWFGRLLGSLIADGAGLTEQQWQQLKDAAPILPLQDGRLVRPGIPGGIMRWGPGLGPDDLALFAGTLPVLRLAVAEQLSPGTISMLQQRFGVSLCGPVQLAEALLGWPAAPHMAQLLPRLRFLARHQDAIVSSKPALKQLMQQHLMLPALPSVVDAWQLLPAQQLYMPASAAIQHDLQQAGVLRFLHPDLVSACQQEQQLGRLLRDVLGILPPSENRVVPSLLSLHANEAGRAGLGQDGMLRHVQYLAAAQSELSGEARAQIRSSLWLPAGAQGGGAAQFCRSSELMLAPTADLQLPAGLLAQLAAAGAAFLHPSLEAQAGPHSSLRTFLLTSAGVRECGANEVATLLLRLYGAGHEPPSAEQNLEHLALLGQLRSRLQASTLSTIARNAIVPVSNSEGELQMATSSVLVYFRPRTPVYMAVQPDFETHAACLFLSPAASAAALQDGLLHELLAGTLQVKQLSPAEVLSQLLHVHDAVFGTQRRSLPDVEREALLGMVRRHLDACARALRDVDDGAPRVPSGFGRRFRLACNTTSEALDEVFRPAEQLRLALPPRFLPLQADLLDAGMRFVAEEVRDLVAGSSQLQLRTALGLAEADAVDVASCIVKLQGSLQAGQLQLAQQQVHVAFLQEHAEELGRDRRGADALSAAKQEVRLAVYTSGSSTEGLRYELGPRLCFLPPEGSEERELLPSLLAAGFAFLHPSHYAAGDVASPITAAVTTATARGFLHNTLGVQYLQPESVAAQLVRLHESGAAMAMDDSVTDQQLLAHLQYLAARAQVLEVDAPLLRRAQASLQVRREPLPDESRSSYQLASNVFYPDSGEGWQLQQVLSGAPFVHNTLVPGADAGGSTMHGLLRMLGVKEYGVQQLSASQTRLRPEMQAAVEAASSDPARARALLLMLRDRWQTGGFSRLGEAGRHVLAGMLVPVKGGQAGPQQQQQPGGAPACLPLRDCFLPTPDVALLGSTLPFVDVPDAGGERWAFLSQLGVSLRPTAVAVLKALRIHSQQAQAQVSAASSSSSEGAVAATAQLYTLLNSCLGGEPQHVDVVRQAFANEALLLLPLPGGAAWVRLDPATVLWDGGSLRRGAEALCHSKVFLAHVPQYSAVKALFVSRLGVRGAAFRDLCDELRLVARAAGGQAADKEQQRHACELYKALAEELERNPAEAALQQQVVAELLSTEQVLLVHEPHGSGDSAGAAAAPVFVRCGDGRGQLYLADTKQLEGLFQGHVRLLAVQPKEVPLVADMLQKHCGAEPPQRLSGAVRQRQEVQGAEQPENDLSALLQQAAPLITRLLYTAGLRVYKRALEADPSLNDLLNMQVASVQEVVAVYSLPDGQEVRQPGLTSVRPPCSNGSTWTLLVTSMHSVQDSDSSQTSKILTSMGLDLAERLQPGGKMLAAQVVSLLQQLRYMPVEDIVTQFGDLLDVPDELLPACLGGHAVGWPHEAKGLLVKAPGGDALLAAAAGPALLTQLPLPPPPPEAATGAPGSPQPAAAAALGLALAAPIGSEGTSTAATPQHPPAPAFSPLPSAAYAAGSGGRYPLGGGGSGGGSFSRAAWSYRAQSGAAGGAWASGSAPAAPRGDPVDPEQLQVLLDAAKQAGQGISLGTLGGVLSAAASAGAAGASASSGSAAGVAAAGAALAGLLACAPAAAAPSGALVIPHGKGGSSGNSYSSSARDLPPAVLVERLTVMAERVTHMPQAGAAGPSGLSTEGAFAFGGGSFGGGSRSSMAGGAGGMGSSTVFNMAVGLAGEEFVCEAFSKALPGFSAEACWASGFRVRRGLPPPAHEPPYDFVYHDIQGKICEAGTLLLIEVKATTSPNPATPFFLTNNEWATACAVDAIGGGSISSSDAQLAQQVLQSWAGSQPGGAQLPSQIAYVVVRVCDVAGSPRIGTMLHNPVKALREGRLMIGGVEGLVISLFM